MFPPKVGFSKAYSWRSILTDKPVGYKKYYNTSFGSYGQAIHEANTKNTAIPRTLGVIYLQELGTLQGKFEVMNLLTENIISHHKLIKTPITQDVIDRVEALTKKDGIKYPLNFKDYKYGTFCKDYDKNNGDDGSIAVVIDEDE